ncbi:hypothetical protein ACIQXG_19250 [Lysinibacillus sphaericus]|uniref:hypothetical protein n=1 Tax=Lysinibacillus sphaericus TaxID=1421 RepID=UPI003822989B
MNLDGNFPSYETQQEIKTTVNGIKTTTDSTKTGVDNLNTNVTSVKADVAVVKSDVSSVKTTVNAVNTNVNTVNSNLGTPTSSASNSTSGNTHSKLNWLLVNSGRVVKSIQRGQRYQTVTSEQRTTIPISTVDISKSLFGVSNEVFANGATLESSAIVMTNIGNGTSGYLSWWVIEFY